MAHEHDVQVFDPPLCCSTGICGPSVDPVLIRFAADLEWLEDRGVRVERFNLAQQPAAFAEDAVVRAALHERGDAALPLVRVGGEIRSSGVYPARGELAAWTGLVGDAGAVDGGTEPADRSDGCCGFAAREDTEQGGGSGCC